MRDPLWIPELGRSPGEGKGCPLQYSGLENSTDAIVHGVAKSWTQVSDFHFLSLSVIYIMLRYREIMVIFTLEIPGRCPITFFVCIIIRLTCIGNMGKTHMM